MAGFSPLCICDKEVLFLQFDMILPFIVESNKGVVISLKRKYIDSVLKPQRSLIFFYFCLLRHKLNQVIVMPDVEILSILNQEKLFNIQLCGMWQAIVECNARNAFCLSNFLRNSFWQETDKADACESILQTITGLLVNCFATRMFTIWKMFHVHKALLAGFYIHARPNI